MKLLIILFVIASIVHADDVTSDYVDGIPFSVNLNKRVQARAASASFQLLSWGTETPPQPEFVCEEHDPFKLHCDVDCSTQIFCMGRPEPFTKKRCPANAKYCVNGECTTIKNPDNYECNKLDLPFNPFADYRCTTEDTHFPDPNNCSRYYYCDYRKEVHGFFCPPGYVYNSERRKCYKLSVAEDCSMIECMQKDNGTFLANPGDPSYYGFCAMREERTDIYMFKCKHKYYQLNEDTQKCEFRCKSEGKFLNPTSDMKNEYYECYLAFDGTLSYYLVKCPPGFIFDEKRSNCFR